MAERVLVYVGDGETLGGGGLYPFFFVNAIFGLVGCGLTFQALGTTRF